MTTSMNALIRSSMQSYKTVVAILAAVIGCIMLLVIGLVLQNALALTPVICIGAAAGCIAGNFGVNPFLSVLFSGIGIMKVGFTIRPEMIVGLCVR